MSRRATEEKIAELQARAHAQRLAAQLAILEARDELAPLRSAVGMIGAVARALAPRGAVGGVLGTLARSGVRHPWLVSTAAGIALRVLRRRPMAFLVAAAAGAAAWWLLRAPGAGSGEPKSTG